MTPISISKLISNNINFNNGLKLESRVLQLPPDILALIEPIKKKLRELTATYESQQEMGDKIDICKIKDHFSDGNIDIAAILPTHKYYQKIGYGALVAENGQVSIYFKIPFKSEDTVKHELIHAYDPKLRKMNKKGELISKSQNNNGFQDNKTAHEIDGYIGGLIDEIIKLPHDQRSVELNIIRNWLRHPDFDINSYDNRLLYYLSCFKDKPVELKRLMSIVYNELF